MSQGPSGIEAERGGVEVEAGVSVDFVLRGHGGGSAGVVFSRVARRDLGASLVVPTSSTRSQWVHRVFTYWTVSRRITVVPRGREGSGGRGQNPCLYTFCTHSSQVHRRYVRRVPTLRRAHVVLRTL